MILESLLEKPREWQVWTHTQTRWQFSLAACQLSSSNLCLSITADILRLDSAHKSCLCGREKRWDGMWNLTNWQLSQAIVPFYIF